MIKNINWKVFFKQKSKNQHPIHVFVVTSKVIKQASTSSKKCRKSQANTPQKNLCFDCTGAKHRASDCRSNKFCLICNSEHHTSTCDKNENVILTTNSNARTYSLVIVYIQEIKFTALVDTGAGAS